MTDASAAASFVDGYQLVIEWGRTPRAAVAAALAANPTIAARTVGVSLSKVKLDKLELFDAREGYGYGSQYMSRYDHRTPEHSLGVGN